MHTLSLKLKRLIPVLAVAGLLASLLVGSGGRPAQAQHMGPADGMICTSCPGATFTLTTQTGYIGTPEDAFVE